MSFFDPAMMGAGMALGATSRMVEAHGQEKTARDKLGDENSLASNALTDKSNYMGSKLGDEVQAGHAYDQYATQALSDSNAFKTQALSDANSYGQSQNQMQMQRLNDRQGDLKTFGTDATNAMQDYANHPGAVTNYNYSLPGAAYKKGGPVRSHHAFGQQVPPPISNPGQFGRQGNASTGMNATVSRSGSGLTFSDSRGQNGYMSNAEMAKASGSDPWSRIANDMQQRGITDPNANHLPVIDPTHGNINPYDVANSRSGSATAYGGSSQSDPQISIDNASRGEDREQSSNSSGAGQVAEDVGIGVLADKAFSGAGSLFGGSGDKATKDASAVREKISGKPVNPDSSQLVRDPDGNIMDAEGNALKQTNYNGKTFYDGAGKKIDAETGKAYHQRTFQDLKADPMGKTLRPIEGAAAYNPELKQALGPQNRPKGYKDPSPELGQVAKKAVEPGDKGYAFGKTYNERFPQRNVGEGTELTSPSSWGKSSLDSYAARNSLDSKNKEIEMADMSGGRESYRSSLKGFGEQIPQHPSEYGEAFDSIEELKTGGSVRARYAIGGTVQNDRANMGYATENLNARRHHHDSYADIPRSFYKDTHDDNLDEEFKNMPYRRRD